jgi:hypothetical protein
MQSFFGTNFVVFQTGTNTILFATDIWIFLAVAIPLSLLTLGIWLTATRREKVRRLKMEDVREKPASFEGP